MSFLITSTGVTANMVFPEWGERTFVHPVSNYDLEIEFDIDEIRISTSLQAFLDDGSITVFYEGHVITTSAQLSSILSGQFRSVMSIIINSLGL